MIRLIAAERRQPGRFWRAAPPRRYNSVTDDLVCLARPFGCGAAQACA
jgi:hypothetical protein